MRLTSSRSAKSIGPVDGEWYRVFAQHDVHFEIRHTMELGLIKDIRIRLQYGMFYVLDDGV